MSGHTRSLPVVFSILAMMLSLEMSAAEDRAQKKRKPAEKKPAQQTPVLREHIESALELPCPETDFPGDTPLSEPVDFFQEYLTRNGKHRVQFIIDVSELELEGITSLEDVLVRGVRFHDGSHTCWDALELIFQQTTEPELTFVPRNGHVLITTLDKSESGDMLESRLYDVSDLLPAGRPDHANAGPARQRGQQRGTTKKGKSAAEKKSTEAKAKSGDKAKPVEALKQFGVSGGGFGGGSGSGQAQSQNKVTAVSDASPLAQLIEEQTAPPAQWIQLNGEGGAISVYGQYMMIRQTYRVHRQVESVLDQLRQAIASGGPPRLPGSKSTPKRGRQGVGGFGGMGGGTGYFSIPSR